MQQTFARLKAENRPALIPCLVAGDPDLDTTIALTREMAEKGADILELVIPFSDPMADGPTVQNASQRALAGGTNLTLILEAAGEIRRQVELPLVMMSYLNPVLRLTLEGFAKKARDAGVDGIIIPELPIEEAGAWRAIAGKIGLDTIFLAAPTSGLDRCAEICEASTGFVYAVTQEGTTGRTNELPAELVTRLAELRAMSAVPVVAGFGITGPDMVKKLAPHVDGLIIASALIRLMETGSLREKAKRVGKAVGELREAIDRAG